MTSGVVINAALILELLPPRIGWLLIGLVFSVGNLAYVVAGDTFYSVDNSGIVTSRGTLNTTTGRCGIASNSVDVVIVDGTNGYTYTIASTTFAQIVSAGFPNGATDVCERLCASGG